MKQQLVNPKVVFFINVGIVALLMSCYFSVDNELLIPVLEKSSPPLQKQQSLPFVSFIIPSSLQRDTLNRTIQSLLNQTLTNWEAIVGVDLVRSRLKDNAVATKSATFLQDPRVRYVPINSNSANRGIYGNGAGGIRNEIIKQFAKSDWVAFVDDDDTLSQLYVERLLQATREQPSADLVVFRMRGRGGNILPPPGDQDKLGIMQVGISFAVRKDLFIRDHNRLEFVPGETEDFVFLQTAHKMGSLILLSNCVNYFVRQDPDERLLDSIGKGPCHFPVVRNVTS